jgi:hypothetical protein
LVYTAAGGLVGCATLGGWRLFYCIVYTATGTEGYNTAGGPGATLLKGGYTEAGGLESYTTEGGLH